MMRNSIQKMTICAAVILCSFQSTQAETVCLKELKADSGKISFQAAGIQFFGSGGGAVVLENGQTNVLLMSESKTGRKSTEKTPMGRASYQMFSCETGNGHTLTWTVGRLTGQPGFTLQASFRNCGKNPVNLKELILCESEPGGFLVEGDGKDWWMGTIGTQDQFSHTYLQSGDLATDVSRNYLDFMTLYKERGAQGLVVGAVGPPESEVRIRYERKEGKANFSIKADMTDIVVDPGETRQTDEVLVLAGSYDEAALQMVKWTATTHGARTKRGTISGWCSWYTGGPKINAKRVEAIVRGVTTNRLHCPIQTIQLDDGWQKEFGDWTADPVKFPEGMKANAETIAQAGLVPGIWISPVKSRPNGKDVWQDTTDPAVQKSMRDALANLVREGYRYFKIDFNYPDIKNRMDRKKTSMQVKRDLFKLYREALGEDVYINACNGTAAREAIGYADAARVGTDVFDWNSKRYIGCGMVNGIEAVGAAAVVNGVWWANDPDCIKIQPIHFPTPERRTWQSFVGLNAGLVICSDQLDNLREITPLLRIMEVMLPPAPDKGRIFDGNTDWWHRQFGFVAERPWGNFVSTLLFNPEDTTNSVALKGVPLDKVGKKFHAFSFWDSKYLGLVDESLTIPGLPPHGSVVLRLTAQGKGDEPVLVGSDLHISMGSAEIKDVKTTRKGLEIVLNGNAGARSGNLYVYSQVPLKLGTTEGCDAALSDVDGQNVYTIKITNRRNTGDNEVSLLLGQ